MSYIPPPTSACPQLVHTLRELLKGTGQEKEEGPRRFCAHPWRSDAGNPSNCPLKCIYFKGDGAETEESGGKDGLVLLEGWIPWKGWLARSEQPGSFSISFLVPTQRPHSPDISSYFPLINEPGRYWKKGEFTALNLQEAPNAGFRSNGTPSGQLSPSRPSQF